jgi:peptidoglycan/xylan/chitin deacetylase (PgdA/CDA1 family)
MDSLKRLSLKPLLLPGVARTLSALTGTEACIFMLHRFSAPEWGVHGHDPAALRRNLAHLRKRGYDLISLKEVFRRLRDRESLKRVVAFTIDDGYFDHARVAAPIFAEFDCPVTAFVVTGFLDGKIWFWWDRLTHIFESTKRKQLIARLGNQTVVYNLGSAAERAEQCWDLNVRCQDAMEADRLTCIGELSLEAGVELPAAPPARFAPMSWDEARRLEKRGMSFGPHTVTHPVLTGTPDAQAEFEIAESWKRVSEEVAEPVPVFCYPNGRLRDFGDRDVAAIRRLGLWGAVVGQVGAIEADAFRVPRFGYRDSLPDVLQCLSGLELLKSRIRGPSA